MKLKFFLLACVTILISASALRAQKFDSLLNKLNSEYPQEKLYLQFDKSIYNPGETIWFKAYIYSGTFPSQISKSFYAELVDDKGNVLQRKIAPVVYSSAAAAFDLPSDLSLPVVYVRAYTKWMLGFDSSFIYEKAIPIAISKPAIAKKNPSGPNAFLQFFPEGGDLVAGLESRVAFKATDRKGLPVNVRGDIVDSKGKKITSFTSVHDGMGFFTLAPDFTEQYKAIWKDPAGSSQQSNLPVAKKSGATLELNQTADGIQFTIRKSGDESESLSSIFVVAQLQQQLLYRAKANLASTTMTGGVIPAKDLPAGIVQVTIFSKDGKPLAERIIFVNHQDYYFITDLNPAIKDLGKKKKNVIQIDVPDTTICNLSVSVTDASLNASTEGIEDIYSQLLLTSDIKGYVHKPAYYFSSDADSVAGHLDLVMMTNGWRRFKWEDVLAGKWPHVDNSTEDHISVTGSVLGLTRSDMLQREVNGILVMKNGNQQFMTVPLKPDGQFLMPGLVFYDTAKVYYQINNDKNKTLTTRASFRFTSDLVSNSPVIDPDSIWIDRLVKKDTSLIMRNVQVGQRERTQMDGRNVKTLSGITIVAKKKSKLEEMNELYVSGMFNTSDSYSFITEDDPFAVSALDVLTYLQGKVPGLTITGTGPQRQVNWRGGTPSFYLNEMQGDMSLVENLPMTDVAMVKVYRPPFVGAAGGGANGAIAVYTKKGKALTDNVKGLDFVRIPGYSPTKEFYSPDYSNYDEATNETDYRTTLYWNPFVFAGRDRRRVYLTFYNNDITKKMRIVVEGVNADGKLTRIEKVFE